MRTVYIYIPDTMADWEIGHISSELNSRRYFRKGAEEICVKTVGPTSDPVRTMGGLTVRPDCSADDVSATDGSVLILPGADTWSDPVHSTILSKAKGFLESGCTVCAICGATVALANIGVLDDRRHTSNGPGFLEMFSPVYKGAAMYADEPAVSDRGLITAGVTSGLEFAREILRELDVFSDETLEAWFEFFSTGSMKSFYRLMASMQVTQ